MLSFHSYILHDRSIATEYENKDSLVIHAGRLRLRKINMQGSLDKALASAISFGT
jgi:hypothetical protein